MKYLFLEICSRQRLRVQFHTICLHYLSDLRPIALHLLAQTARHTISLKDVHAGLLDTKYRIMSSYRAHYLFYRWAGAISEDTHGLVGTVPDAREP